MKEKQVIVWIFLVLLIIGVVFLIGNSKSLKNDKDNNEDSSNEEEFNCANEEPSVYYKDEDVAIYSFCLDEASVVIDDKNVELKDYLSDGNSFSEIVSKLTYNGENKTDKYIFYEDEENIFLDDISVIKWDTVIYENDKPVNNIYFIYPSNINN